MPRFDSIKQYSTTAFAKCLHCDWQHTNCRTEEAAKRLSRAHSKVCKGNKDIVNTDLRIPAQVNDPRISDRKKPIGPSNVTLQLR